MDSSSIIMCSIELNDAVKPYIIQGKDGRKYLSFNVSVRKGGVDQYGNTHTVYIRVRNADGSYENVYIGKGKEKVFNPQPQGQPQAAPAPQPGRAFYPAPAPAPAPQPEPSSDFGDDLPF